MIVNISEKFVNDQFLPMYKLECVVPVEYVIDSSLLMDRDELDKIVGRFITDAVIDEFRSELHKE